MKFYADHGRRRTLQFVADALALLWSLLWILLGVAVRSSFSGAESGADKISKSSDSLGSYMGDVGSAAGSIPLAGAALERPLGRAADAARDLGSAGHDLSTGLGRFAMLIGFLTAITPMFAVLVPWALLRGSYARRAGRIASLRQMPGAEKMLALEGLHIGSAATLRTVGEDPAGSWQAGDPRATSALADIALDRYGLKRLSTVDNADPKAAAEAVALPRAPRGNSDGAAGRQGNAPWQ